MKKLIFVILALLIGVVACEQDTANQASEENASNIESIENTVVETSVETTVTTEEPLITPGDISEEARKTMYQTIFEYNKCMMASRLSASQDGRSVQEAANDIMASCETHINTLQAHLLAHNVNEPLVIGMAKKLRSRAARQLMTQGMNLMAAQAGAVINAEKIKAEAEAEAEMETEE